MPQSLFTHILYLGSGRYLAPVPDDRQTLQLVHRTSPHMGGGTGQLTNLPHGWLTGQRSVYATPVYNLPIAKYILVYLEPLSVIVI